MYRYNSIFIDTDKWQRERGIAANQQQCRTDMYNDRLQPNKYSRFVVERAIRRARAKATTWI